MENMEHDAEQGLEAHAQQPPAVIAGGGFEDTLRSAVLHLLLSLSSPCRARRPRRVANGCDRPSPGQYILDEEIVDLCRCGSLVRGDRIGPPARSDLT